MVTQEQLDRINALARKSRTPEGLTAEEQQEQAALRRLYIDSVKESLVGQLESLVIVDQQGNRRRVRKRGDCQ